jgi:hypothetical protein
LIQNFKKSASLTCVSSGCKTMLDLGLNNHIDKKYVLPLSILKHFFNLKLQNKNIEFIVLGNPMEHHMQSITTHQRLVLGFYSSITTIMSVAGLWAIAM